MYNVYDTRITVYTSLINYELLYYLPNICSVKYVYCTCIVGIGCSIVSNNIKIILKVN